MKLLFLFAALLLTCSASSQNLSFYGGPNQNMFYHIPQGGPDHASYTNGDGFQFGFGIDSIRMDWMTTSFTLGLTQYSGGFDVRSGGNGGSNAMEGNITKTVLDIGIYPIHFSATRWVVFRFGFVGRIFLDEQIKGIASGWSHNGGAYEEKLEDSKYPYSRDVSFGLSGKVMLNFKLGDRYHFGPYYSIYHSLLRNEFGNNELRPTKALQQAFGVTIARKINLYKK